jgi:phosphinothricin acetyltransferase
MEEKTSCPAKGPITVRDAKEGDFETITSIYAWNVRHGTGSFEIDPPDRDEMMKRWRAALAWSGIYLVAERGGQVLGFAYAGPHNTRAAYRGTVEDSIYICPLAQHKGIGTMLLTELIRRCRRAGFRQLVSVVGDSGNKGSVGLHEKLGFAHCGGFRAVGRKFGRDLDVVFMQLDLTKGAEAPEAKP